MIRFLFTLSILICFGNSSFAKRSPNMQAKVKKELQAIAAEINSAKTVGQWIDRAPRNLKVFRRTHFSENLKSPMPTAYLSGQSIVIQPKGQKKERHLLRAEIKGKQIFYFVDGINITRRKGETMDTWLHRLYGKKHKKKKVKRSASLLSLFFTPAFANSVQWDTMGSVSSNRVGYWAALMGSMSADEWNSFNIIEDGANTQQIMAGLDVSDYARSMAAQENLYCGFQGAQFDFAMQPPAGGFYEAHVNFDRSATPPLVRVSLRAHPNGGSNSPGSEVGRIAYPANSDGTVSQVYTYNGSNNQSGKFSSSDSQGIGSVLQSIESYNPGGQNHSPSSSNPSDYMSDLHSLQVMSDVALAACSNQAIKQDAGVPGDVTPVNH